MFYLRTFHACCLHIQWQLDDMTVKRGLGGFKLQTVFCLAKLAGIVYFPASVFVL